MEILANKVVDILPKVKRRGWQSTWKAGSRRSSGSGERLCGHRSILRPINDIGDFYLLRRPDRQHTETQNKAERQCPQRSTAAVLCLLSLSLSVLIGRVHDYGGFTTGYLYNPRDRTERGGVVERITAGAQLRQVCLDLSPRHKQVVEDRSDRWARYAASEES